MCRETTLSRPSDSGMQEQPRMIDRRRLSQGESQPVPPLTHRRSILARPPKRRVTFAPLAKYHPVENLLNVVAQEELWQSKAERRACTRLDLEIVQRMMLLHHRDEFMQKIEEEWTMRGLEHYFCLQVNQRRRRRKFRGALSVVLEQQRQDREELFPRPDLLGAAYRRATEEARNAALRQGFTDADSAERANRVSPLPKRQQQEHEEEEEEKKVEDDDFLLPPPVTKRPSSDNSLATPATKPTLQYSTPLQYPVLIESTA